MLDAIFITNASKHANHASMTLSWFGVDLVVDLLLAVPFHLLALARTWGLLRISHLGLTLP
jgi:hypothetical protein